MAKFKMWFQEKMRGRYGNDKLNNHLLIAFLVFLLAGQFLFKNGILIYVSYAIVILMYFRMFSRNINKRYRENYAYSQFLKGIKRKFKRIKDSPKYKYVECPSCSKTTRVPRGKGEIVVTCPSCKHKFDAKS